MNRRRSLALACVCAAVGCGAPPWQLAPLDGRPSIPPGPGAPVARAGGGRRRKEKAAGRRVLEISALQQLDSADALLGPRPPATGRAADGARDRVSCARARHSGERRPGDRRAPGPERGAQLGPARAVAAVAAGDAWKAIGAREEAQAAYMRAAALGGVPAGDVGILPRRGAVPAATAGSHPPTSTATCSRRVAVGAAGAAGCRLPVAARPPDARVVVGGAAARRGSDLARRAGAGRR